jgi:hypothetical protein
MNKIKDKEGFRRWPKIREFSSINNDLKGIEIKRLNTVRNIYEEEVDETEFEKYFKYQCERVRSTRRRTIYAFKQS